MLLCWAAVCGSGKLRKRALSAIVIGACQSPISEWAQADIQYVCALCVLSIGIARRERWARDGVPWRDMFRRGEFRDGGVRRQKGCRENVGGNGERDDVAGVNLAGLERAARSGPESVRSPDIRGRGKQGA